VVKPTMIPVDSAGIASIGYDAGAQELYVRFRDGESTYVYSPVPEFTYRRLLRSDSKGAFVNREIKPHYEFREV
jgi:hypothetical protein